MEAVVDGGSGGILFVHTDFDHFRAAVLYLIALRNERLEALLDPDPDLQAEVEDLEYEYVMLINTVTEADKQEIGEFWRLALEVFGSDEEIFVSYPDAAALMLVLRIEAARRQAMEVLRPSSPWKWRVHRTQLGEL